MPTSIRIEDTHPRSSSSGAAQASRAAPVGLKGITGRVTRYAGATYLSRALAAVRAVINARFLGPELYGFWGLISFVLSFGYHLHGGVQDMVMKQVPAQRSAGRGEEARRTVRVAVTFFGTMLLLMGAGLLIVAACLPTSTPSLMRIGWAVAAIVLPLEALYLFAQIVARSEERFTQLGRGLIIATIFSLLLTFWLVTAYGLAGLLVVAVTTPAVGIFWITRRMGYVWHPVWDWEQIQTMIRSGWPILSMTLVWELLRWIDRGLVLAFVGLTGFGYYVMAVMLMRLCVLLPEVVAAAVEPRIHYDYARQGQAAALRDHLWLPLRTLSILLPIGLVAVHLALPGVIERWLPAYLPGISVMQVLLVGSFFMGLAACTKAFIVAIGAQRRVLKFYGLAAAVNLLGSGILLALGWGLTGIALGTAGAYGVCSTSLLVFAFRRLGWSLRAVVLRLALLYTPLAILYGLIGALSLLGAGFAAQLGALIGFAAVVAVWLRPWVRRIQLPSAVKLRTSPEGAA